MSDNYSVNFNESPSGGHPHDLLARLYREIGISAVAAALEVSRLPETRAESAESADAGGYAQAVLGDELAA
jgi:hypothetical protein